jgi:hypothetical protein
LRGWIIPSSRGTFELLEEFEPGAVQAEFLHVADGNEIVDTIAWEKERPGVWWARRDLLDHVGAHELDAAWWDERPARLLPTPADYVAAHGHGFVILDWSADINAIIGKVAAVECATAALYRKLKETLIEQAMPRGLTITVRAA